MLRPHLVLLAASALVALSSACGGDAPPPAAAPAPALTAAPPPTPAPAPARPNPFAAASTLAFQAPPFDQIQDTDYEPAIDLGMTQQLAEVAAITALADAPTFENTVVAMERSGQLLGRVTRVFESMTVANTNEALQAIQKRVAPKLAAHEDAVYLDPKLWARVKAVYDQRASLDADSAFLVQRYHTNFVRAGAELSEGDKSQLRALNAEESSLSTAFKQKLLAATKDGALVLENAADLRGLDDHARAALAEVAKARKLDGRWVIRLENTTQQPLLASLAERSVREKLFRASTVRAERGDDDDTRATILRLAELRARKAKLLGYPTWGAYVVADAMAETPERAMKLVTDLAPAALANARKEAARMQALVDKEKGGFKLEPWDWQYYSERIRKADYALDDAEVKPYFELDRVLQDGLFFAAHELYGISFKERHDLPVYHPDVRVFEVSDADGSPLALFYADFFKRDNKEGGAFTDTYVEPSGLLGTRCVFSNVASFPKPAPGEPALLSTGNVRTMFHEFGHGLHHLFSTVKYPALTRTPRDFVEFPSQFNEHWATEPRIFASYARHYKTGAPMPAELAAKIEKARLFGQGFALTEALEAEALDMAWHTLPDGAAVKDVDAFEADALKRYKLDYALVPPRYRTSYFQHIWGNSYSAAYYAYLWTEVLSHDAYAWFKEHGGLTRANGQRFREMVLSQGHQKEVASMYRAFRGKDPGVEPLLEFRGLKAAAQGARGRAP